MAVVWAEMGAGKGGWQKTVTLNGPQEQGTCAEVSWKWLQTGPQSPGEWLDWRDRLGVLKGKNLCKH